MERNLGETVALGLVVDWERSTSIPGVNRHQATADHDGRSTRYYGSWDFFYASTISPEMLLNRPARRQSSSGFLRRGNHGLSSYTGRGGTNRDMGREGEGSRMGYTGDLVWSFILSFLAGNTWFRVNVTDTYIHQPAACLIEALDLLFLNSPNAGG